MREVETMALPAGGDYTRLDDWYDKTKLIFFLSIPCI